MSCNCVAKEELDILYKKYGDKHFEYRNKDKISFKLKKAIYYIGVCFCMIFIIPYLFVYILYKTIFTEDKRISFAEFFHLRKNNKNINIYVG